MPTLGQKAKMGGLSQKVPRQERVADSLAGNYDAIKDHSLGQGDGALSSKVHGTSATRNILNSSPQMPPVIGQPAVVSAKNFKPTNPTVLGGKEGAETKIN